jgi:hypothetical protein
MQKHTLGLICLLFLANIVPAYGQTKVQSVTLLQTIELIKKERISTQDQFHIIQSKIGAPGAKPTPDELKLYADAVVRIKNLRYSFGYDPLLRRVYFRTSSNQTQNKLGEEEFGKAYSALIGYDLKTEPPFTAKDIDQASLCLRSMFKIVNLDIVLNTQPDKEILKRIKAE